VSRAIVLVAAVAVAGCASTPRVGQHARPHLEVTAHPRMAFGPLRAVLMAQLQGGDDGPDFYCPRIEWSFGDGGGSVRESDCPPWTSGTPIERHFSVEHCYRTAGDLPVVVTLWQANRKLAQAGTTITVIWSPGGRPC
jgi:hypothetical protein